MAEGQRFTPGDRVRGDDGTDHRSRVYGRVRGAAPGVGIFAGATKVTVTWDNGITDERFADDVDLVGRQIHHTYNPRNPERQYERPFNPRTDDMRRGTGHKHPPGPRKCPKCGV